MATFKPTPSSKFHRSGTKERRDCNRQLNGKILTANFLGNIFSHQTWLLRKFLRYFEIVTVSPLVRFRLSLLLYRKSNYMVALYRVFTEDPNHDGATSSLPTGMSPRSPPSSCRSTMLPLAAA